MLFFRKAGLAHAADAFTGRLRNVADQARSGLTLSTQRPIGICLYGDQYCFSSYKRFTAPHPKFPFVSRKSFGAALRDLDVPFESLFSGARFQTLRRKVRRADSMEYKVELIDPIPYSDRITQVNTSTMVRQGRSIGPDYLDPGEGQVYLRNPGRWYGVFDSRHILRAYCHVAILGDCCIYSRILGHADYLKDGIMYLMVRHTVEDMHRFKQVHGYPRWVMYDMFLGGKKGLRDFKRRAGFSPERVDWRWVRTEQVIASNDGITPRRTCQGDQAGVVAGAV